MRLVCTSSDRSFAENFYRFLGAEGVEVAFETVPAEGETSASHQVWVIQEDDFERAADWYAQYEADPHDPRFASSTQELVLEWMPSRQKKAAPIVEKIKFRPHREAATPLSSIVLFLCCVLFFTGLFIEVGEQLGPLKGHRAGFNPINKALMFDYPVKWALQDELYRSYTDAELMQTSALPPEGRELVDRWVRSPIWEGYYPRVVRTLRTGTLPDEPLPPTFEKIQEGQFWRLVTPAFLHGSILHILFNMLWLTVLGRQLESRIGGFRYILFIIFTAMFSNMAQYLMSGPAFVGYSGVVLAMLAFIATRRKRAPWEGYLLQPGTLLFVSGFVLLFVILQLGSFVNEVTTGSPGSIGGMANTAHVAGAFAGWLAARSGFFTSS